MSRRPNQVRPLTDAQPRIAEITRAEGCRRLRLPTAAYTLSFERKASPFLAKTQFEFPNPAVPTAVGIRVRRRSYSIRKSLKFTNASPNASRFESPQLHQAVRASRSGFPSFKTGDSLRRYTLAAGLRRPFLAFYGTLASTAALSLHAAKIRFPNGGRNRARTQKRRRSWRRIGQATDCFALKLTRAQALAA